MLGLIKLSKYSFSALVYPSPSPPPLPLPNIILQISLSLWTPMARNNMKRGIFSLNEGMDT